MKGELKGHWLEIVVPSLLLLWTLMKRWAVFLGLWALLLACSPTRSVAPLLERPVTVHGRDSSRTATFDLAGGTYRVDWKTESDPSIGRLCIASLGSPETRLPGTVLFSDDDQWSTTGDDRIYGVEAGTYYIKVIGCGTWTITLAPI